MISCLYFLILIVLLTRRVLIFVCDRTYLLNLILFLLTRRVLGVDGDLQKEELRAQVTQAEAAATQARAAADADARRAKDAETALKQVASSFGVVGVFTPRWFSLLFCWRFCLRRNVLVRGVVLLAVVERLLACSLG